MGDEFDDDEDTEYDPDDEENNIPDDFLQRNLYKLAFPLFYLILDMTTKRGVTTVERQHVTHQPYMLDRSDKHRRPSERIRYLLRTYNE